MLKPHLSFETEEGVKAGNKFSWHLRGHPYGKGGHIAFFPSQPIEPFSFFHEMPVSGIHLPRLGIRLASILNEG
jgi:hypothetical protein